MKKIKLIALLLLAATARTLSAAPLTATAAVHTRPEEGSPVVTFLKAGSEPVPTSDSLAVSPAGWMAVDLPGPHEGYVQNKDILKSLDVRAGASVRLAPKPDAPELTLVVKGDKTAITGLHGKWTQISLQRNLTGFIKLSGNDVLAPAPSAVAVAPAPSPAATPSAAAPLAPAPVTASAYGVAAAGQAAPAVSLGDSGASLPRFFQGKFVSTKRAFAPRRPYDWALNDNANVRFAYLDITKLLLTEQIESYVDHQVVVFGTAKPAPGGKDIVIEIESLQLK